VQYWAPASAGAGVTLVMAYLNGNHVPNLLRFNTLISKFVGTVCAVSSGLPMGPEGPMVHIGACVASCITYMECSESGLGPSSRTYETATYAALVCRGASTSAAQRRSLGVGVHVARHIGGHVMHARATMRSCRVPGRRGVQHLHELLWPQQGAAAGSARRLAAGGALACGALLNTHTCSKTSPLASVVRPLHDCGPPTRPRPKQATSTEANTVRLYCISVLGLQSQGEAQGPG
jgi:hypothetical protein